MTQPAPSRLSASLGDRLFAWLCQSSGLFVLAIALSLVGILTYQAWPALKQFGELKILTSDDWDPNPSESFDEEEPAKPSYGALLYVYGTVMTSLIAMLVAVPLGVGAAAYLSEISNPRVRKICSFLLELLAAIPSVIFGFWAVEFLAKRGLAPTYTFFGLKNQSGEGIVAAGLVLAVMILPYITALSYDVCQAVPRSQREGSLSLGATRWQTIWKVVLPYARPGIIAACFLALGRAIGETMAVTMVIGNAQHLNFSLTATGDSIPSAIAKQLHEAEAVGLHRPVLISLGLVLLGITIITNVLARLLIRWASRPRVRHGRAIHVAETTVDPVVDAARLTKARKRAARTDRLMTGVLTVCQLLTVIPLFLILGYITYKGAAHVTSEFFTNMPQDSPPGLRHALVGSFRLVGLAALAAIPVGILCAILLSEYRNNPLVGPVRFITELLAGVPSIIIGVFGFALLVYPFWFTPGPGKTPPGFSAWAGAFALAVMMLPVVIRSAEEAMRLVPGSLREASYALGATRRQTVLKVIIPAALPAIITGILLAIGRIAGETAPLILTARGSQYMPHSLSDATPSLPYYVYDYATQPNEKLKNLAWAGAFVLVCIVLMLNVSVRLLAGKRVVAAARAD
jgi:phosphate transport system permease protein